MFAKDKIKAIVKNSDDIEIRKINIDRIKEKIKPEIIARKIILYYFIFGSLWVVLSDRILSLLSLNSDLRNTIELYKGWIFVGISSMFFYLVILSRIKILMLTFDELENAYEEVSISNNRVARIEDELKKQLLSLKEHQRELKESNLVYEMIVNGVNDGIWHRNFESLNTYYSLPFKAEFGYNDFDFKQTEDSLLSIIHPEDRGKFLNIYHNYLDSKKGIYTNEFRLKTKAGDYRWVASRGVALWDNDGNPMYIAGSHTDITEQKLLEDKLYSLAYYDSITKLPNRHYLYSYCEDLIKDSVDKDIVLAYLDIDDFKNVNETLGHNVGDELLKHIGKLLTRHVSSPSLAVRLGGDEYVVLFIDIDRDEVITIVENIFKDIRQGWTYKDHNFYITTSVGLASSTKSACDIPTLLRNADIALSHVKENGKDGYAFFTMEMAEKTWEFIELDNQLKKAIDKSEFKLFYQPQIDIQSQEIIGLEALIRWFNPIRGLVSPMEFIPYSEKTGYIFEISQWVFQEACNQKSAWEDKGYKPIKIAVNLSGKVLAHKDLIKEIESAMRAKGLDSVGLELEITETAIMDDMEVAIDALQKFKDLDISISLDDFGSGYSSLSYLRELPIDMIKIDGSFIGDIEKLGKKYSILKLIVQLAHTLDLKVLAEGVETKEQYEILKEINCDYAQGYYFYRPMPAEEIEKILV